MKKLVAALVLVGTLGMASGAMAYGHGSPRGGGKYVEDRGKGSEFGVWITFQRPKLDRRYQEREREKWENHRHHRRQHRPHHRY